MASTPSVLSAVCWGRLELLAVSAVSGSLPVNGADEADGEVEEDAPTSLTDEDLSVVADDKVPFFLCSASTPETHCGRSDDFAFQIACTSSSRDRHWTVWLQWPETNWRKE